MKKLLLTFMCLLGVMGCIWAQESVYKTLTFSAATNSEEVSSYTTSWTATCDGFTWNIANFNNNKNGWDYVKCGRKNNASVATITTASAIDKPVTKVVVTIDAITASNVNSIKLKVSATNDFSNPKQTVEIAKAKGAQTAVLSAPAADLFYQLEFDCASGSSNGLIQISKVEYYASDDTSGKEAAGLAFNPSSVTCKLHDIVEDITFTQATNAVVTFTSSNPGVAVYEDGGLYALSAGTATITATSPETETYAAGTATLTVTVLDVADNIAAFKEIGANNKAYLKFDNAIVIAKASNGNTYVQDATGGICFYKNVPADFTVGSVLNGEAFGTYALYNGLPELSEGDYTGVTVTEGTVPAPKEIEIDDIKASDICTLVTIKNAHCEKLAANAVITQTGNTGSVLVYTTFMAATDFPAYQNFDVTGVLGIFKTDYQILPRYAADFTEIEGQKETIITVDKEKTMYVGETDGIDATVNSGATLTYTSDNEAVATVDANGVITAVAAGTAVITITAPAYEGYPEATATMTVTVKGEMEWVMLVSKYNGKYYAAKASVSNKALAAVEVQSYDGKAYVETVDEDLLWYITDDGKIMSHAGKYIKISKADISLTDSEDGAVTWEYDETEGYWINGSRALIYKASASGFKNYATSNIGTSDYGTAAVAMPYVLITNEVADGSVVLFDGFEYKGEGADNVEIAYVRSASATNYIAWYAPFDVEVSEFEAAAEFNGAVETEEGTAIEFIKKETGFLSANTPYIVKVKADTEAYTANGTLKAAESETVTSGSYSLTGVYEQTSMAGRYGIANDGAFHPGSANAVLKPFRFYLTIPASQAGKPMKIVVNGTSSSVEGIAVENAETGEIYDLQGRKVANPNAGVYIINGKKVIK